jgi:hypothetical protein
LATVGLAGESAIDWRAAAVTVMTVEPVTLFSVAEMVDVPGATAVASPVLLIEATDVVAETQVTWLERLAVVPSE